MTVIFNKLQCRMFKQLFNKYFDKIDRITIYGHSDTISGNLYRICFRLPDNKNVEFDIDDNGRITFDSNKKMMDISVAQAEL